MPAPLRHTLLSLRDLLSSVAPFVLLTLMLLALAYWWLDPMPPRRITLATGPAQSAYDELGKRYVRALKSYGIEVQLQPSQGAAHNLELLRQGKVDIAFVQGGTGVPTEDDELESLGSLFVEPVWFFYRSEAARKVRSQGTLAALGDLKGLRLNMGAEGSGVPSLMQRLFEANRIDPASMTLSRLDQTPAVVALLAGEIDALVLASAPESLMVQMLLQTPGVRLMDFSQSEAYARRFSFLTPVTLPRGVVDLARDIPAQDVRLIATTTTLLQLFSQASLRLHGPAGWFNRAREFPNAGQTEFPLAQEAERTLKNGVPLLQRYLSFTLANLLERMWLALGIIIAILLPLSRIVPPLYAFRIRSRVFRWYAQLRQIEDRMQSGSGSREELLQALNQLEMRAAKVKVPLSYADELYALRNYIEMVRSRLK
jgi:hypothetical protein